MLVGEYYTRRLKEMQKFKFETFSNEEAARKRAKELRKRKFAISYSDYWKCYILAYNVY